MLKLKLMDYNTEFETDIKSGNGFLIRTSTGITKDEKRDPEGIYSPKYGTELDDNTEYSKYSCNCGALKGRFFEDTKCEVCGSVVKHNFTDIRKTGWLVSENYDLINPLLYLFIAKIIGPTNLENIIKFVKDIDKDGNFCDSEEERLKNPYANIGLIDFKENFDEILDYFYNLKKDHSKKDIYDFIKENRDNIFINKIPIYSTVLRPVMIIHNKISYSDINKKITLLVSTVLSLNKKQNVIDRKLIRVLPNLYQSQIIMNEIFIMNINEIGSKDGHIRSNLLGNRINFSARQVIGPNPEIYKINEVRVPYIVFLEMYHYHIVNLLCKIDGMTVIEAENRWHKSLTKFDNRIYQIMEYLVKNTKNGMRKMLNRNPTISYGSMLTCKIVEVKKDFDDLTLSISNNILGLLEGDYDGDVLNDNALPETKVADIFEKTFNPRMMIIDRNNGKFNGKMGLIKDQMIGFYKFNHIK